MIKKTIKNKKGMTLLEMIVAIAIFVVVAMMSSEIFVSIIKGQRNSIAQQNTQENMRYVFEVLSKEIRQAQRSNNECLISGTKRVFNVTAGNTVLYFKNRDGECVSYALVDGVLVVRRGTRVAPTTPSFLEISGLSFEVVDNDISFVADSPRVQPRVTLKMKAKMKNVAMSAIEVYMETTISSRYYE